MAEELFNSNAMDEVAATAAEIEQSIVKGLEWLAGQQNPDGSWGTSDLVARTGLAVLKFETRAIETGFTSPFDPAYPYHTNVEDGLNFIFSQAQYISIDAQPHGNPDVIGDGKGLYFNAGGHNNYTAGIALMAVAGSTTPDRTVTIPGDIAPITYGKAAQYLADYLAWAQTDTGFGRGGWDYSYHDDSGDRSDNSISGWVVTGLIFAESPVFKFNTIIPAFVKSELNLWIDYIQNKIAASTDEGGSGYDSPTYWVNILKTGSLIQQLAFVGDPLASQRVQKAIDYIVRHWNDPTGEGPGLPGWNGTPAEYQATFTMMKGLTSYGVDIIGQNINWFDEVSTVIVDQQNADGSWPISPWSGDMILSATWALLTLEKASPVIIIPGNRGIDFNQIELEF